MNNEDLKIECTITSEEQKMLSMMFKVANTMIEYMNSQDTGYSEFGANELFNLSEKLGIEY